MSVTQRPPLRQDPPPVSRRHFLVGLGSAAAAAAFLAACGDGDADAPVRSNNLASASPSPSGTASETESPTATERGVSTEVATISSPAPGFSFTDGRGVTVTLDDPPQRIVAYHAPAAALWHLGIRPVGVFGGWLPEESPNLEDIDVGGMEDVGHVYGEIDFEKLALLEPDLIVTAFSPIQGELTWGFADLDVQKRVEEIAPVVAIDGIEDPTDVIASFEELGRALGTDLDRPEYLDAKARFDAAVADLQAATSEKPGMSALALSPTEDGQVYFAEPQEFPALRQMATWGLEVIDPTGDNDFWEIVSFEEVNKYPADLLLLASDVMERRDQLAEQPTWSSLPAVRADQIAPWDRLENWSYAAYAADIEAIVEVIRRADPHLVS